MFPDMRFNTTRSGKPILTDVEAQKDEDALAANLQLSQESPFDTFRVYVLSPERPDIERGDLVIETTIDEVTGKPVIDPETSPLRSPMYRVSGIPRWYNGSGMDKHMELLLMKTLGDPI